MLRKGELLGSGSFGQVWALKDNKSKVVKESRQSELDDSSLRELYGLSLPEHPDLIRSNRVGKVDPSGTQIIMPRAISSLGDKMRQVPELSLEQVASIIYQLFCALDALHSSGIIHYDVKPHNILVFSWPKSASPLSLQI